jgi:hypothetical protein
LPTGPDQSFPSSTTFNLLRELIQQLAQKFHTSTSQHFLCCDTSFFFFSHNNCNRFFLATTTSVRHFTHRSSLATSHIFLQDGCSCSFCWIPHWNWLSRRRWRRQATTQAYQRKRTSRPLFRSSGQGFA